MNKSDSRLYKARASKLIKGFLIRLLIMYVAFNMVSFNIISGALRQPFFDFYSYIRDYSAIHLLTIALAVVLSAYLVFYRKNITIEVTDKAIRFMRGGSLKKEYRYLPFADYEITSYVWKIYGTDKTDSKQLQVTNKSSRKTSHYKCDFLSKGQFDDLMTRIMSPNHHHSQQQPSNYQYIFTVNKETFVDKVNHLNSFLIRITILLAIFWVGILIFGGSVSDPLFIFTSVFLALAFLAVFIKGRGNNPFIGVTKQIILSPDNMVIDEKVFNYSDLQQIRATPPRIDSGDSDFIEQVDRKLILVPKKGRTKTFTIGRVVDSEMEYADFCNELMRIFSDRFVWDVG